MDRVRKTIIFSLAALALAAGSWGCNGSDIDDPDFSDSVLIVEGVNPAALDADVSPTTDPNSLLTQPPKSDIVGVDVRNLNRTQSPSGDFGDIQITSFDLDCANPVIAPLTNVSGAASLTVPAQSSGTVMVGVFPGAFKEANAGTLLGQSSQCTIVFQGFDLAGEPILSQAAVFVVNFVDTP